MASDRIDCGIDLGTTNSAIVRMEGGEPRVVKNDMQGDTTPSAVAFGRRGRRRVGNAAYRQLRNDRLHALKRDKRVRNVFVDFKRTMGTDHVYHPGVDPAVGFTSEALSSELLKALRGYVLDGSVNAAVVTIPAAFTVPQQQATNRAGELAGLRQCHLLQEPVAAAMAFGLQTDQTNEKWLVFDFGGGTFDAALVLAEDGVITVRDTEGDNFLGGKDLDRAIVEQVLVPEVGREHDIDAYVAADPDRRGLLRDALMNWAEEAKNALSYSESHTVESDLGDIMLANGDEVEIYVEVTRERLRPVVGPLFQRAIDKARTLLDRHGLRGSDLDELILVGGPTFSPILREMLTDQIRAPNTSVDPMTVVARGAALFASTIALEDHGDDETSEAVRLDLGYEATTISVTEFVTVKCRDSDDADRLGPLEAEFHRRDTGWSSGRQPLAADGALFEVTLEGGRPNVFDIVVTTSRGDRVESHPSEITILHGTKVVGSPLPNSLGVEVWDEHEVYRVFRALKGAEKSMPLPVTGKKTDLRTSEQVRPGVAEDRLLIRIYEGGADAEGKPVAICKGHVRTLRLTGDQVNRVIPAGTEFELTVQTEDTSAIPKRVTLLFPSLEDEEYDLPIPSKGKAAQTDWIDHELEEARKLLERIRTFAPEDSDEIEMLEARISDAVARIRGAGPERGDHEQASDHFKEALRELYGRVEGTEWLVVAAEVGEVWTDLRRANAEEGYDELRTVMRETRRKLQQVKHSEDVSIARDLIGEMKREIFRLKRCEWAGQVIRWGHHSFDRIDWKNTEQARSAVEEGTHSLLAAEPCESLLGHAGRIMRLVDRKTSGVPKPPVPRE